VRARFGPFLFDEERRELLLDEAVVPLSPKAFDLLALLVRHAPRALRTQEIYDALWPDTFVELANLHNLISELRSAMTDRERSIIRTRRRFGYAFGADLERLESTATAAPSARICRITFGGRTIELPAGRSLIGRENDCAIVVDSPAVSRYHAAIDVGPTSIDLHDLGSKNGTFLGRRRIASSPLADGDVIEIGRALLRVRLLDRSATTVTDGDAARRK
jgi:DNA-binding winged helix-turn-helix (wHTH) protein